MTPRRSPAPGHMGVDYEERVDFAGCATTGWPGPRPRSSASECGAFLLFDFYNIRYTTQTWIGGALGDKMTRYALLTRDRRPGAVGLRLGGEAPQALLAVAARGELPGRLPRLPRRGRADRRADGATPSREIKALLDDAGVADQPVGVDIVEPPFLFEMQRQGLTVVDAQQLMLDARRDQVARRDHAAHPGGGDGRRRLPGRSSSVLKPGIRENEIVALANKRLYEMGSDQVEAINAISGERCNPHPHNFTDRMIRPGDQAFFDIIHSFNGYRTCYYRTFSVGSATPSQRDAYTKAREWMDRGIDGDQRRRRHRRGRRAAGRRRRSSASAARWRRSGCSSRTGSASGCTSGRSSRG